MMEDVLCVVHFAFRLIVSKSLLSEAGISGELNRWVFHALMLSIFG